MHLFMPLSLWVYLSTAMWTEQFHCSNQEFNVSLSSTLTVATSLPSPPGLGSHSGNLLAWFLCCCCPPLCDVGPCPLSKVLCGAVVVELVWSANSKWLQRLIGRSIILHVFPQYQLPNQITHCSHSGKELWSWMLQCVCMRVRVCVLGDVCA